MEIKARGNSPTNLAIYALAAVDTGSVRVVDGHVTGRWLDDEWLVLNEKEIRDGLEGFLNTHLDEKAILSFTRRYGPLFAAFTRPGDSFKEDCPMRDWTKLQERLRSNWHLRTVTSGSLSDQIGPTRFIVENGRAGIGFGEWQSALRACLLATPRQLLKECKNPDCDFVRYFIRREPQQQYCSPGCSGPVQRQSKLDWWNKHGRKWRKQRAEAKSRKKPR